MKARRCMWCRKLIQVWRPLTTKFCSATHNGYFQRWINSQEAEQTFIRLVRARLKKGSDL